MDERRTREAASPDGQQKVKTDILSESRPPFRRVEIESLVLGSVAGAAFGGYLLDWTGAIVFAIGVGALLRWFQRQRNSPLFPNSLRQAVWWPLSAFDTGAVLIDRTLATIRRWHTEIGNRRSRSKAAGTARANRDSSQTSASEFSSGAARGLGADYIQRNLVGLSAATALVIGFFMPWARVIGSVTINGSDLGNLGSEGMLAWGVPIGGLIAIVLYLIRKATRITNAIIGLLPCVLFAYYASQEGAEEILGSLVIGAYVVVVAGIVLILAPIKA